jgi:hypothetical protein
VTSRVCETCTVEKPLECFEHTPSRSGPAAYRSRCIECQSRTGSIPCLVGGCAYIARSHQSLALHRSLTHGIRGKEHRCADLTAEEQARLDRVRAVVNKGDRIDSRGLVALLLSVPRKKSVSRPAAAR